MKYNLDLLMAVLTLMLSGCTWNASIKSLNESQPGISSSEQVGSTAPECSLICPANHCFIGN